MGSDRDGIRWVQPRSPCGRSVAAGGGAGMGRWRGGAVMSGSLAQEHTTIRPTSAVANLRSTTVAHAVHHSGGSINTTELFNEVYTIN